MGKLDGQVALITGADSGIGRATALTFAREGAAVFILYHSDEEGARTAKDEIEAAGGRAVIGKGDVGREEDVIASFSACIESLGVPTILVNNAGINTAEIRVKDMTLERWERTLQVNLTGPFLCSREFLRRRPDGAQGGKIINVTSVHQEIPSKGAADYDASKGGLRNLTTTLALELAEQRINVNNLAPGMVLTPMNQEAIDDPEKMKEQVANIPWRRAGEPEEVAALALYLASSDADYITGTTFVIDGGLVLNLGQGA
jgi:glucose 1-dehydrogenase